MHYLSYLGFKMVRYEWVIDKRGILCFEDDEDGVYFINLCQVISFILYLFMCI